MKKYKTIVVDPPWQTTSGLTSYRPSKGAKPKYKNQPSSLKYNTMTLEEIKALPINELADENSHLYLWTINAFVRDAYDVVKTWGFNYPTMLVWVKKPRGFSLGGDFKISTEYCLYARKGRPKAKKQQTTTWWLWPRKIKHSQKPEAFIDMVMETSPDPYLELFARRKRLGWDVWGNEVESDIDLKQLEDK